MRRIKGELRRYRETEKIERQGSGFLILAGEEETEGGEN